MSAAVWYSVYTVTFFTGCLLGVKVILHLILVVRCSKKPIFGAGIAILSQTRKIFKLPYYQSHCSDSNQILQNVKYLQILFVCCPKMSSANPRLEKKINHYISATVWPILIIYTSYDVFYTSYDMFLCKDVPFGGYVNTAPYFWGRMLPKLHFWGGKKLFKLIGGHVNIAPHCVVQMPKKPICWAWIGIFKPKAQNIQTFVLSNLLQRFEGKFAQWYVL